MTTSEIEDRIMSERRPQAMPPTPRNPALELALGERLAALDAAFPIIRDLIDPDDCWFDHHGGCQAHGYISLRPGETCPQYDAKQWIRAQEQAA